MGWHLYWRIYGIKKIFLDPSHAPLFAALTINIFSYVLFYQTGSGKTFTITGGAERYVDRGIIPRTLSYIYQYYEQVTTQFLLGYLLGTFLLHLVTAQYNCQAPPTRCRPFMVYTHFFLFFTHGKSTKLGFYL